MSDRGHLGEAVRLGIGAARRNVVPGAVLWVVGIALVLGYYFSSGFAAFLDGVGEVKQRHAPWFGMMSTAFFGSIVPLVAVVLTRARGEWPSALQTLALFVFWAVHGLQVDQLYKIQSWAFGDGIDVATIVKKVLVDEFIWVPFLAVPQLTLGYLWVDKHFSVAETRAALQRTSFLRRAIPLMIANWMVWIPTCAMVYIFPLALQLPLMNLVLGMWCLIITFFAKNA